MNVEREQQLVSAFVVPRKRERYVEMVSSKKARAKFLQSLYHFGDFDLAWVVAAPHAAEDTIAELQRRGPGRLLHHLCLERTRWAYQASRRCHSGTHRADRGIDSLLRAKRVGVLRG